MIAQRQIVDESILLECLETIKQVFPLQRSISGKGIDEAFNIISATTDGSFIDFSPGDLVCDWQIPQSWCCEDFGIIDQNKGEKIIHFDHPLRVASHSTKVDCVLRGNELKKRLVWSKKYPQNLSHRYIYYRDDWSISVTKEEFDSIDDNNTYRVYIEGNKSNSNLRVFESVHKGSSKYKIFFLSHLCHPAQFNDGLVGVLLNLYLKKYLERNLKDPYYRYHFLYMPETIGSHAYCSDPSRIKDSYFAIFSEMTALKQPIHVQKSHLESDDINGLISLAMSDLNISARFSPFLKVIRNDEKVFNAPGFDVPSASITRAWGPGHEDHPFYGYHTDLDDIDSACLDGLREVIVIYQHLIHIVENDYIVHRNFQGIPMLSRHKLFVDPLVDRPMYNNLEALVWAIKDPIHISKIAQSLDLSFESCYNILMSWADEGLVSLNMKGESNNSA